MSLPDEKQVERALKYLEESEEAYAQAIARKEAADLRLRQAREIAFLECGDAKNVEERKAVAGTSAAVSDAIDAVERAFTEAELLKAKRQRALLVCEVWRSLNSNRRAGIV